MAAWGGFSAFAWTAFQWKHEWLGQWGDSFGPLTSIASTLTMVFALWSVHMQRRELELQRHEMSEARKQYEEQARAQRELADQQFLANILSCVSSSMELGHQLAENDKMGLHSVAAARPGHVKENPLLLWMRLKAAPLELDPLGPLPPGTLEDLKRHVEVIAALDNHKRLSELQNVLNSTSQALDRTTQARRSPSH